MIGRKATQAPTTTVGALPPALPANVATAVRVAQTLLAEHHDTDHRDLLALNRAHGALTETLRILLRALGADPTGNPTPASRCPATHPEDPTPCVGPVVVTVLDNENAGADGCEHHAARLLASLTGGRPVPKPDAPAGISVRVFRAAHHTRPFPWREEQ
ncbi:hypothetical protein [Streptomyces griseosporeus]